jgi:hypothetical protein
VRKASYLISVGRGLRGWSSGPDDSPPARENIYRLHHTGAWEIK